MKNRALVLGFDGADWEIITKWARAGKLPNFRRLMELGVSSPLESTIPPITPPAWTSMVTGKNPGKHGIFSFVKMKKCEDGWKKSLYTSRDKKSIELWDLVENSIVVNVPVTYPPKRINGIMVSGMLTPSLDTNFTYPPEFRNELLSVVPDYIIELNWAEYRGRMKEFLKRLYEMTENRIKLFWYLFKNKPWKLFFFVFVGPDRIQHVFWGTKKMERYWERLDSFIGDVIDSLDENTYLFVVSDHGFQGIEKSIHLNNVLMDMGFLKFDEDKKINDNDRKATLIGLLGRAYLKLPRRIQSLLSPIANKVNRGYSIPKIDFNRSSAFCIAEGAFGGIFINSERKESIVSLIEKNLKSIKDENDKKPIKLILKREELYTGKFVNEAPDLIVLPNNGYTIEGYSPMGAITRSPFKNGDHGMKGIFFVMGRDVSEGELLKNAKIIDIMPTILHVLGVPIPKDVDGQVLLEIFKNDSTLRNKKPVYYHLDKRKRLENAIKRMKSSFTSQRGSRSS